ncbi:MAG: hypothetical protein M3Q12_01100 [Pseudomonadota bacterium]|nr:hypothetical protein [Pseudomonadota bacterium]
MSARQPITAAERSFDHYAELYMTPGRFFAWLECGRSDRQQSAYWGPISNNELRALLLGTLNYEQYVAVMLTLKRRFVAEHAVEIAKFEAGCEVMA